MGAAPHLRAPAVAPPLEKRRLQIYAFQALVDICIILAAHSLAASLYLGSANHGNVARASQMLVPLYLTIAFYNAAYSRESLVNWRRSTLRMAAALFLSAALFNFIAFYAKTNAEFSRVAFTLGLAFSFILMAGARWAMSEYCARRFGPGIANVLVIEDDGPPVQLQHAFRIRAADHGIVPSLADPHALDRLAFHMRNMDRVVVSCPIERRVIWSLVLKGSGMRGELVSELAHNLGAIGVHRYDEAGQAALIVSSGPLGLRARAAKRLFDLLFAGTALILLSPLFVVIALLVIVEDGGPALFRQQRLGRGNRFFAMFKFRTMRVEGADPHGHRSASRGDDRVTHIGRFLRRTSLDEIPQLFNVLLGQMSIVGPRPHAIGSSAGDKLFWEIDTRYWQRHALKPGMTGLAQIRGLRGATHREVDLQLRLQSDLEYLDGWSIWRDARIVFLTLRVLIHARAF